MDSFSLCLSQIQCFQDLNFFYNSVLLKLPDYKRYMLGKKKKCAFKILPLESKKK